jgi:hypothetical protein
VVFLQTGKGLPYKKRVFLLILAHSVQLGGEKSELETLFFREKVAAQFNAPLLSSVE